MEPVNSPALLSSMALTPNLSGRSVFSIRALASGPGLHPHNCKEKKKRNKIQVVRRVSKGNSSGQRQDIAQLCKDTLQTQLGRPTSPRGRSNVVTLATRLPALLHRHTSGSGAYVITRRPAGGFREGLSGGAVLGGGRWRKVEGGGRRPGLGVAMESGGRPSLGQFILLGTSSVVTAVLYSVYRQKAQVAQQLKVSAGARLVSG